MTDSNVELSVGNWEDSLRESLPAGFPKMDASFLTPSEATAPQALPEGVETNNTRKKVSIVCHDGDTETFEYDENDTSGYRSNGNAQCNDQDNTIRVRVIKAVRPLQRLRTHETLGARLMGKDLESKFFRWSSNTILLWSTWWLGSAVGLLVLAGLLAPHFIAASALMLPLPVLCTPMLAEKLAIELLSKELEVTVLLLLQSGFCVAALNYLRDVRSIYWACYFPTMCLSVMVDAYPASRRKIFTQLLFISKAIVLVCWDLMIVSGVCPEQGQATWQVGKLVGGCGPLTFTTSITLLIFCWKHLKVAFLKPECLVILKSALQTDFEDMELITEDVDGEMQHVLSSKHVHLSRASIRCSELPWASKGKSGDSADQGEYMPVNQEEEEEGTQPAYSVTVQERTISRDRLTAAFV